MASDLPSFSKLSIVQQCAPAACLPGSKRTTVFSSAGTARHRVFQRTNEVGLEKALKELDPEERAYFEMLDLRALPLDPKSFAAEVTFAYDPDTDTARELGRGLDRDYSGALPGEFVGTVDVEGIYLGSTSYVGDYKFGQAANVTPTAHNIQLRAGVLAAARARGMTTGIIEIIHMGFGQPYFERVELSAFELEQIAEELRQLKRKILAERERRAAGGLGGESMGEWCKYCDCLPHCPAMTGGLVLAAQNPDKLKMNVEAMLDPETAAQAYQYLSALEIMAGHYKQAIHAFAKWTPLELGNGMVLCDVPTKRDSIDTNQGYAFLEEKFGRGYADLAVTRKLTKKGLRSALGKWAKASGVTLESVSKEVLEAFSAGEILTTKTGRAVKKVKREKWLAIQAGGEDDEDDG